LTKDAGISILAFASKKKEFGAKAVFDQPVARKRAKFFEKDRSLQIKMKKVIALSAVLVLGALGMACGQPASNANANANKAIANAANAIANAANAAANQAQTAANAVSNAVNAAKANANVNVNAKPASSPK